MTVKAVCRPDVSETQDQTSQAAQNPLDQGVKVHKCQMVSFSSSSFVPRPNSRANTGTSTAPNCPLPPPASDLSLLPVQSVPECALRLPVQATCARHRGPWGAASACHSACLPAGPLRAAVIRWLALAAVLGTHC